MYASRQRLSALVSEGLFNYGTAAAAISFKELHDSSWKTRLSSSHAARARLMSKFSRDRIVHRDDFRERFLKRQIHAALLEGAQNFLRRDISHEFILREWTTAQAAHGGIETTAARLKGRKDFRDRRLTRAMQMHAYFTSPPSLKASARRAP